MYYIAKAADSWQYLEHGPLIIFKNCFVSLVNSLNLENLFKRKGKGEIYSIHFSENNHILHLSIALKSRQNQRFFFNNY